MLMVQTLSYCTGLEAARRCKTYSYDAWEFVLLE